MPIDERVKQEDLAKLQELKVYISSILENIIKDIDEDDLEFGYVAFSDIDKNLWNNAIEQNNYYEVKTDVLEHHDGVYVKCAFVNGIDDIKAEKHVNIRSNGKVETSHRCFVNIDKILAIIERQDSRFKITFKA